MKTIDLHAPATNLPRLNWLSALDAQALLHLAGRTHGPILEIGCQNGHTTRMLAQAFPDRTIHAVDCLGANTTLCPQQLYEQPQTLCPLARHLLNVRTYDINSRDFDYTFLEEPPGLVFIDGDHSYAGVKADSEKAFAHLKQGIVVWHDCYQPHPAWVEVHPYLNAIDDRTIYMVARTWLAFTEIQPQTTN